MKRLDGRVILLVEDEPLVAFDVVRTLRDAGARVLCAGYQDAGLSSVEHPDLSGAVIDLHLSDGSGAVVCERLRERGIPFVVHTGYPRMLVSREWSNVPVITKPAQSEQIVSALVRVLH